MAITTDEVATVARLAKLQLAPGDEERMAKELDAILSYVKKLDELDTSSVPPTLGVTVTRAPVRADVVRPGVERDAALAEAPRSDGVGYLVPGFVDES